MGRDGEKGSARQTRGSSVIEVCLATGPQRGEPRVESRDRLIKATRNPYHVEIVENELTHLVHR